MNSPQPPPAAARRTFKIVRILILVFILVLAGGSALYSKLGTTDWEQTLEITIYPLNADGSPTTETYLSWLDPSEFDPVKDFMAREAHAWELPLENPINISLAPEIETPPPDPPRSGSVFKRIWWSLKMRWYGFKLDHELGPSDEISIVVLYHDPKLQPVLEHSFGLQKGLLAVVHAFANPRLGGQNQVVMVHELLHTLGASDKYDPATERPLYPDGFVDPEQQPLYPQYRAEIMAGSIPLSEMRWEMARNLNEVEIGFKTAQEIKWIR